MATAQVLKDEIKNNILVAAEAMFLSKGYKKATIQNRSHQLTHSTLTKHLMLLMLYYVT